MIVLGVDTDRLSEAARQLRDGGRRSVTITAAEAAELLATTALVAESARLGQHLGSPHLAARIADDVLGAPPVTAPERPGPQITDEDLDAAVEVFHREASKAGVRETLRTILAADRARAIADELERLADQDEDHHLVRLVSGGSLTGLIDPELLRRRAAEWREGKR